MTQTYARAPMELQLGIAAATLVLGALVAYLLFLRPKNVGSEQPKGSDGVGTGGEAAKGDEFPAGPLAIFFGSQVSPSPSLSRSNILQSLERNRDAGDSLNLGHTFRYAIETGIRELASR